MSRRSPFVIDLSEEDRFRLESLVRKQTAERRMVVRARIVLLAADGVENVRIAERLEVALNTVIKWRKRFWEEGVCRDRSGWERADLVAIIMCTGSPPSWIPQYRVSREPRRVQRGRSTWLRPTTSVRSKCRRSHRINRTGEQVLEELDRAQHLGLDTIYL